MNDTPAPFPFHLRNWAFMVPFGGLILC